MSQKVIPIDFTNKSILPCAFSAHGGNIGAMNQLQPALRVVEKYPEVDLIELEIAYDKKKQAFVSFNGQETSQGDPLDSWFEAFFPLNKRLWLNIQDTNWSAVNRILFSKFPLSKFAEFMKSQASKWNSRGINVEEMVILGCQYQWLYDAIRDNMFGRVYLIHHLPYHSAVDEICPCRSRQARTASKEIQKQMMQVLTSDPNMRILALDQSYFQDVTEMTQFLEKLPDTVQQVIVHSFQITDPTPKCSSHNLQIIVQYDYTA